jgi:hypothetical protein
VTFKEKSVRRDGQPHRTDGHSPGPQKQQQEGKGEADGGGKQVTSPIMGRLASGTCARGEQILDELKWPKIQRDKAKNSLMHCRT